MEIDLDQSMTVYKVLSEKYHIMIVYPHEENTITQNDRKGDVQKDRIFVTYESFYADSKSGRREPV